MEVASHIKDLTSKSAGLQEVVNWLLAEPLTDLEKICDGQMRCQIDGLHCSVQKLQAACKQLACVAQKRKHVEAEIAMMPDRCRGHSFKEDAPDSQGVTHAQASMEGIPVLPPGVQVHWQKVVLRNARNMQPEPTVAMDGFELKSILSRVKDWADRDHADELWRQEVIEVIKEATGAQHVIFLHEKPAHRDGMDKLMGYGVGAHTDYSQYCEENLPDNIKDQCRGKHFGIYNLWRSTDMHLPVQSFPLAFLHPASVCPSDLVYCEQYGEAVYKKLVEEKLKSRGGDLKVVDGIRYSTFRAVAAHLGLVPVRKEEDPKSHPNIVFRHVHSKRHSWLYFPDMTPDEILIFRQYDSRIGEVTKAPVVHAAFRDPSTPADAPCRTSCDIRVVCIFDERPDEDACKARRLQLIKDAFPGVPSLAAAPRTPDCVATYREGIISLLGACKKRRLQSIESALPGPPSLAAAPCAPDCVATYREGIKAILRGAVPQPSTCGHKLVDLWDQGLRGVESCGGLASFLEHDPQVPVPEWLAKQQGSGASCQEVDNTFREPLQVANFCFWAC